MRDAKVIIFEEVAEVINPKKTFLGRFLEWIRLKEEDYEEDLDISKFESKILKNPVYALPSALAIAMGCYGLVYILLVLGSKL